MDENSLRSALGAIASDPEPPTAIDIAAACRRGRRRQWAGRAVAPVAVALAVALAVAIPYALPRHASPAPVLSAPTRFDPLVPYADFGWLPPGYTQELGMPAGLPLPEPSSSATTLVRAAFRPHSQSLVLKVYARGACTVTTIPSRPSDPRKCIINPSGAKPASVGGRLAWEFRDAQGPWIDWEYAPSAWATIASMNAFEQPTAPARSPASMAQLHEVGAHVKFGQHQALAFPYRLAGPLPAGWQVLQASFVVSGKALVGYGLEIGPASRSLKDPYALEVAVSWPKGSGPDTSPSGASKVTKYGVTWDVIRFSQTLITTGNRAIGASGLGVWITLDGHTPLGDPFEVFHRMTLLGTSPANWTTRPLG